jgi:hypothetical protein
MIEETGPSSRNSRALDGCLGPGQRRAGFTWEHPAHLYLKRTKADSMAFGTPDTRRSALASLVNLSPR